MREIIKALFFVATCFFSLFPAGSFASLSDQGNIPYGLPYTSGGCTYNKVLAVKYTQYPGLTIFWYYGCSGYDQTITYDLNYAGGTIKRVPASGEMKTAILVCWDNTPANCQVNNQSTWNTQYEDPSTNYLSINAVVYNSSGGVHLSEKYLEGTQIGSSYLRYPLNYTPTTTNGWGTAAQSFGSLNLLGTTPHAAEDWNLNTGGCSDQGESVYAIADGLIKDITPLNGVSSGTEPWGRTIIIQHDAPSGRYFLHGSGEIPTTVYSMYAHLLESGQTGYDSNRNQFADEQVVKKGDIIGQVGNANGYYGTGCHLHFEILTDLTKYRKDPYSWSEMTYRTAGKELIGNGLYFSAATTFSLFVHPYECSGSFKLNPPTTPNCDGTSSTIGNWTRQGDGTGDPEIGYSGIIFSKGTNSVGTATWSPTLPRNGQYKVWVHVPAEPSSYASSTSATYTVNSNGTTYTSQTISQYTKAVAGGGWVDIGTYNLYAAGSSMVSLQGNTGETAKSIAVDAVKFEYIGVIP